jgi:hypothetical protein
MHDTQTAEPSAEKLAREIDRVSDARSAAASVVDTIRRRNGLPREIRDFIGNHWQRHLELIHVRLGHASPEWEAAVGIAAELVLAADPALFPTDPDGPVNVFDRIQPELDLGLAMTGMGATNRAQLLSRLRTSLGGAPAPAEADAREEPPATPSYVSSWLEHARRLRVGSWLEFRHPDGRSVRAKLCWASSTTGKRLFVNHQGLKYAEKTVEELANELGEKRAFVVG